MFIWNSRAEKNTIESANWRNKLGLKEETHSTVHLRCLQCNCHDTAYTEDQLHSPGNNRNVKHLGGNGAGDGKLDVDVHLGGLVLEVDGGEVLVIRFGEVKGELVVNCQVVCK